MVVPAPGHEHDTTIALPGLAADPTVLATIVVAPFTPERGDVPGGTSEGFDAQITFDRIRAGLRIWPAIDPANTNCLGYPNPRHEEIAAGARETLTAYASIDPGLDLPDPTTFDDTASSIGPSACTGTSPTPSGPSSTSPLHRQPTPRWISCSRPSKRSSSAEI